MQNILNKIALNSGLRTRCEAILGMINWWPGAWSSPPTPLLHLPLITRRTSTWTSQLTICLVARQLYTPSSCLLNFLIVKSQPFPKSSVFHLNLYPLHEHLSLSLNQRRRCHPDTLHTNFMSAPNSTALFGLFMIFGYWNPFPSRSRILRYLE